MEEISQKTTPLGQKRGMQAGRASKRVALAIVSVKLIYMPLTNFAVAEEALSLSPAERAELIKLLLHSLEEDPRTDEQIKADLTQRLQRLRNGSDPGLTFEQVFGSAL